RLCSLATRMAAKRSAGRPTGLLARAVARSAGVAGTTDRSSATGGAEVSGSARAAAIRSQTERAVGRSEPARRSDTVHDVAGSLQGVAAALHGSGRHSCRHSDSEPKSGRARAPDWILRQHLAAAHKVER